MGKHKLGVDIQETCNPEIIKVSDISIYAEGVDILCPELVVLQPGFEVAKVITKTLTPGFNLVLTACDLGIQKKYCESVHEEIPDGIYSFRYAVAPQDIVKVEYNYLRTTSLCKRIKCLLEDLYIANCNPTKENEEIFSKLERVQLLIEAAKVAAEVCNYDKSMEIYEDAKRKLSFIECKNCQ